VSEVYSIDIQAAMPEGDSVSAKLDALTKSFAGAERGAGYLDAAVKQMGAALTAAKGAAADADAALADGNATWTELEANANRAAKALEKASAKGAVPDDVAAQAAAARAALDGYAVTLGKLEAQSAHARTSEQALALAMVQTKDASKAAATAEDAAAKAAADAAKKQEEAAKAPVDAARQQAQEWRALGGVLRDLPGPLGKLAGGFAAGEAAEARFAGRFGNDAALLFKVGAGIASVTAALALLAAALVVGAVKIAAWAVGLADSKRSADLTREAVEAMHPELVGLRGTIDDLTKSTGMHADELSELAGHLREAGVSSDRLAGSLKAAALAETALGKGGATDYIALEKAATDAQKAVDAAAKAGGTASKAQTDALKKARTAADDFAATAQTKLGGVVARQMLSLDAQSERFKSNVGELFGGLNIDPVLEGMRVLVALFDKNTAAGQALQFLFESVFQPLIDNAKVAAQIVEAFYLGVLIGAMKLYLAVKPVIKAVADFFGLDDPGLAVNFELITKAGQALAYVFAGFAAIIGVVIGVVGVFVAALAAIPAALIWIAAKFQELGPQIASVISGAIDFVKTLPAQFMTLGAQLVAGLAQGIAAGASAVVGSISNVVSGAISAAKGLLGIASPSKVFAGIGGYTAEGFAGGVEDSTDAAHQAMETMVSPAAALDQASLSGDVATVQRLQGVDAAAAPVPAAAPAGAEAAASTAGGSKPAIHVENMTINASDRAGGQEAADGFLERVTEWLESDAAQAAGAF
jgi:hypothetical protein